MPAVVAASYGFGEKGQQAFASEAYTDRADVAPSGMPAPLTDLNPLLAVVAARWGQEQVRFVDIRNPGDTHARVLIGRVMTAPGISDANHVRWRHWSNNRYAHVGKWHPCRTRGALGLHEGLFAPPLLRWLYLPSGLLGTTTIATGLLLWTKKRRTAFASERDRLDVAMVERFNVGTIVGLSIGIAAYFWANRLIAADLPGRSEWEIHIVHSVGGDASAWIAGVAYGLLPLLNH